MGSMGSPRAIALLFLALFLCVSGFLYYPRYRAESAKQSQLASVLAGADKVPALGARTQSSDCAVRGALPDPTCSPGAIFSEAAPAQFCVAGYTKTVRNVSTKLRKEVYAEYRLAYPQPFGTYEVDHIIPLAIGGNNDIANLFPEAAAPAPGFREKDLVEVYLQEEVCAGRVATGVAQEKIAGDWLAVYDNLSPEDIARLRAAYRSWSN